MHSQERFCAFCRTKRRLYLKRHAGAKDLLSALVLSVLVMLARWQEFNPRVIVIFVAFLILFEIVIQVRHRLELVCQFCGFDPVLYKKSPESAATLVKTRLQNIQEDPDFLLSERAQSLLSRLKRVRRSHSETSP